MESQARSVSGHAGVPEGPAPAPEEGCPPWPVSTGRSGMQVMQAEESDLSLALWPSELCLGPASSPSPEGIYGGTFLMALG